MRLVKATPIDPEAYQDSCLVVRIGPPLRGRDLQHLRGHYEVVERGCKGWGDYNTIVKHSCSLVEVFPGDFRAPHCAEYMPKYALALVVDD